MKHCPYCGYANYETATECRKCLASFHPQQTTVQKSPRFGPEKARALRRKALAGVAVGLLMRVYWGGYGPWPVIDNPTLADLRDWLEPALVYGGVLLYLVGWVLHWL